MEIWTNLRKFLDKNPLDCKPKDDEVDIAVHICIRFDSTSVHARVYISPN